MAVTFPNDPAPSDDWEDTGGIVDGKPNAADMQARTTDRQNQLRAAVCLGKLGSNTGTNSGSGTTFTNVGQNYASDAQTTITLAYPQMVRLDVSARFRLTAGTSGTYTLQPAYNSGSSATPGSATLLGDQSCATLTVTGAGGVQTVCGFATVALAAGTYTFYGVLTRASNGASADYSPSSRVLVSDYGGR